MVQILESKSDASRRTPLRLVHWKARLVRYNLKAYHIPGVDNIADYLSRCLDLSTFDSPHDEIALESTSVPTAPIEDEVENSTEAYIRQISTNKRLSFEELQKETEIDPVFQLLTIHLRSHRTKLPEV